jgi:hypothetical protein
MIVYDDLRTREKIRIYDARVERPPHYDTFAEFQYSYHYGDSYIPYLHQEEPLKLACQHFADCIKTNSQPLTDGRRGLEMVRILEAAGASLKMKRCARHAFSSRSAAPALSCVKTEEFRRLKHSLDEWLASFARTQRAACKALTISPQIHRIKLSLTMKVPFLI